MQAIAKTHPGPGIEIIEVPEPSPGPGEVKIQLSAASVCGTDLHIYRWDHWAASRIQPPRVIGHEFCGIICEVGPGVTERNVGDYVSSESHIVCGHCKPCLAGQAHVCLNTKILGVDVDGGFAPFVVVPVNNARPTDLRIPPHIACFQDALGNAVHTVASADLAGKDVLITGMGPIGLFAVSVARARGAARVVVSEVSPYRCRLAEAVGVDDILDPEEVADRAFDVVLEMSGHPSQLQRCLTAVRPGGQIRLLGVYGDAIQPIDINAVIFGGIDIQGIVGRRLWQTWDLMQELLIQNRLNLAPVITHSMPYTDFSVAMDLMQMGEAGKVVFTF